MVRAAPSSAAIDKTRQTLDEFYADLEQHWRKAEEILLSLRAPTSVTVRIKTVEPSAHERDFFPTTHHELGYIKHYGRWSLCYGVLSEEDSNLPAGGYWVSIFRCSAEQQVEAAEVFPGLLAEVTKAAEGYTSSVRAAVVSINDALNPKPTKTGGRKKSTRGRRPAAKKKTVAPAKPTAAKNEPPTPATAEDVKALVVVKTPEKSDDRAAKSDD